MSEVPLYPSALEEREQQEHALQAQTVFFNRLDLYHTSPDSSELRSKSTS